MLEVVDRLEAQRPDGTDEFMIGTSGEELIDDVAYVMTFTLNRTFSRNHDQVHRMVPHLGDTGRRRGAASLFPNLFDPGQAIQSGELEDLKQFMDSLLALGREDFVRVMRAVRNTVDSADPLRHRRSERRLHGPGLALESLGEDDLTIPVTWDRYDGRKPESYKGNKYIIYGQVTQFDSATGTTTFSPTPRIATP